MIIEGLKRIDPIAYIRYAIVYLGLDSMASVRDMIDSLLAGDQNGAPRPSASPETSTGAEVGSGASDDEGASNGGLSTATA